MSCHPLDGYLFLREYQSKGHFHYGVQTSICIKIITQLLFHLTWWWPERFWANYDELNVRKSMSVLEGENIGHIIFHAIHRMWKKEHVFEKLSFHPWRKGGLFFNSHCPDFFIPVPRARRWWPFLQRPVIIHAFFVHGPWDKERKWWLSYVHLSIQLRGDRSNPRGGGQCHSCWGTRRWPLGGKCGRKGRNNPNIVSGLFPNLVWSSNISDL